MTWSRTLASCGLALAAAALASAGKPSCDDQKPGDWSFSPVRSIKVRVQGNLPVWDPEHGVFVASFGKTFEERHRAVLDTVNMASVEGAFKFVQAECINYYDIKNNGCKRKNDIQYVVFYETIIAQPRAAMAKYQEVADDAAAIEHCPFVAMDGGQCSPVNGTRPKTCDEFIGDNGSPKLGMCVGGQLMHMDPLAPYPDTYWHSFPNSCPTELWKNKTEQCRTKYSGGLCPFGVKPDGVTCSFSYRILGWVALDDVVGITSMTNPATNATYRNYTEFCRAGGIEYKVNVAGANPIVEETIPFWKNPLDREANRKRSEILVSAYNKKIAANPASNDGGVMVGLPDMSTLQRENPPCYVNNRRCAKARFGCRRRTFSQICEVCEQASGDCVAAPSSFVFPQL
ncbi:hypothetical protein P43SY_003709 [Pythium insidiosum]|uniref:Secreted protein n=1 Tax=Pythium insidiosum TaxID=114742 RepID=A0AAD5M3A3_PYTIN|nr:hypothetical protein P43SY_003709 [Pythium insidiosum]